MQRDSSKQAEPTEFISIMHLKCSTDLYRKRFSRAPSSTASASNSSFGFSLNSLQFIAVLEKREKHKWVIPTKTIVKPSLTLYCLQIIAFITEFCNWISSREFTHLSAHTLVYSEREFRQEISMSEMKTKNNK